MRLNKEPASQEALFTQTHILCLPVEDSEENNCDRTISRFPWEHKEVEDDVYVLGNTEQVSLKIAELSLNQQLRVSHLEMWKYIQGKMTSKVVK